MPPPAPHPTDRIGTHLTQLGPPTWLLLMLVLALVPESVGDRVGSFSALLSRIILFLTALGYSWSAFRATAAPRRTALRAAVWIIGISLLVAVMAGYSSDEACEPDPLEGCPGSWQYVSFSDRVARATWWLTTLGIPVLLSDLLARRVPGRTLRQQTPGGRPDLTGAEVLAFLREKVPQALLSILAGGAALVLWGYAVMRWGGWGLVIGPLGMILVAVIAVGTFLGFKRLVGRR